MTRPRRAHARAAALTLVVALVAVSAPAAGAAKRASVPCTAVAVSPSFGKDRTVFCAAGAGADRKHVGPVRFYTSTDAGRTWGDPVTVGQPEQAADGALLILPSPQFETDRTVFVETRRGGFVSWDAGRTFQRLTSSQSGSGGFGSGGLPTVYADDGVPSQSTFLRRPAIVAALGGEGCCDKVFENYMVLPRYLPPGGPFVTRRYLVPPDFATRRTAVAVRNPAYTTFGRDGNGDGPVYDDDARVHACDADLACARVEYEFPRTPGSDGSHVSYVGPTYPGSLDVYAVVHDHPFAHWGYRLYRSRDHGRTWAPWTSATRLARGYWWGTQVHVAGDPQSPNVLWLRVSRATAALERGVVSQELFRSEDGGSTWRRAGRAWSPGTRAAASLPWNAAGGGEHPVVVAPGGHLYLIGEHRTGSRAGYLGLYCSHDYGRTWVKGC